MHILIVESRQYFRFYPYANPSSISFINRGGFLSVNLVVDDVSEKAYLYNITTAGKEGEMLTHVEQKQTGIKTTFGNFPGKRTGCLSFCRVGNTVKANSIFSPHLYIDNFFSTGAGFELPTRKERLLLNEVSNTLKAKPTNYRRDVELCRN